MVNRLVALAEQSLRRPLVRAMSRLGLSPNQITLTGLFLVVCGATVLATTGQVWIACVFLGVGWCADLFDGALARTVIRGHDFALGGWLDTLSDKVGEAAVILSIFIAFDGERIRYATIAVGLSSWLVSFIKSSATEKGIFAGWPEAKLLGHAGRVLIMGCGLVIISLPRVTSTAPLFYALAILVGFNTVSFAERGLKVLRISGEIGSQTEHLGNSPDDAQQAVAAEMRDWRKGGIRRK